MVATVIGESIFDLPFSQFLVVARQKTWVDGVCEEELPGRTRREACWTLTSAELEKTLGNLRLDPDPRFVIS